MVPQSRILPACTSLYGLVLFAVSANIVFASLIRVSTEFGISPEVMASVSAVQFGGFFLASMAGGLIADAVGKKPVLLAGGSLVFIGALLWSRAPGPFVAFAGSFVMGMGGGIMESMCSALLTDLFPERRKFFLNLSQVAYCLGAISGPALMGRLLPLGVPWRAFFTATALGAGVFMLLLGACRSLPVVGETHYSPRECSGGVGFSIAIPCSIIFLYVLAEMSMATFMNPFLRVVRDAPEQWAIYAISLFWLGMILGRLGCAWLPEDAGHEMIIAGFLGASGLVCFSQLLVSSWVSSVCLFALLGLTFAGTWPLIVSMVAARHPSQTGTAVGFTVACGSLGCVAGPPIFGAIMASAWPDGIFLAAGMSLVAGAAMAFSLGIYYHSKKTGVTVNDSA